jgi:FkbH-like protein
MRVNASLSDYMNAFKALPPRAAGKKPGFKAAVLSSFTLTGIREVLTVQCAQSSIDAEVYLAPYGQISQELLDPQSGLNRFAPDLTVILIDLESFDRDYFFTPYSMSAEDRERWSRAKADEAAALIEAAKRGSPGKVLFHDLEVPSYSPMGILEDRQSFGFAESVETVNRELRKRYAGDPRVFLFGYDRFCSRVGKDRLSDPKMKYLGDLKLSFENMIALCHEYMGYIKPLCSRVKKCIVVDLDNTLWGGILGEDGPEGIRLDDQPAGRAFGDLQRQLLALSQRGLLLAVNSRNDAADALRVIREHPGMVLREKHFSAMRINWEDKAANLEAIAKELNIGIESLVFVDDDPVNCERVGLAFPDVTVVRVPADPSRIPGLIPAMNDLNALQVTDEDLVKGRMYAEQKERTGLLQAAGSLDDYLRELKTEVLIKKADRFDLPRVTQLTQKTNQFNMTTRRRTEDEMAALASRPDRQVLSIRVKDKFGDSGIVGLVVLELEPEIWRIETFLLSCRVLGRKVEEAVVTHLIQKASQSRVRTLTGCFIPTAKNAAAASFYSQQGFTAKAGTDPAVWELDLAGRAAEKRGQELVTVTEAAS